MAKKRIAILGGGMAGLSAAYELTRTSELQAQHEVTVYQLGWRLGGKAASSRDRFDRNLEHGLHVWFGCYHNMFSLTREVYAAWKKPAGCPFQDWTDVAKPQVYTPLGVQTPDGKWTYFPLTWPTNDDVPGEGGLDMSPAAALTTMINLFAIALKNIFGDWLEQLVQPGGEAHAPVPPPATHAALPDSFLEAIHQSASLAGHEFEQAKALFASSQAGALHLREQVQAMKLWGQALQGHAGARDPARGDELVRLFDDIGALFQRLEPQSPAPSSAVKWQVMGELVDLFGAVVRGYVRDLLVPDQPFDAIDDVDFRAWLLQHGARPDVVNRSSIVHTLYDTMFQYIDGDVTQPSYAAGSALGVLARLLGTFKGSVMWNIQAGMGEAVVAPLYDVLRDHGVKFQFFRKVAGVKLDAGGARIGSIELEVQARTRDGEYRATYAHPQGFACWPSEPDWSQLVDGDKLKAVGAQFENHWWTAADPQHETLQLGQDFDEVVLAIAMGAYKPLNAVEPSICQPLIDANPKFRAFVDGMGIVPSLAVQFWTTQTPATLGWTTGQAAMVAGPQPLDIWDDMSHVLQYENSPDRPKALYYLCGTLDTRLYREPTTASNTPAKAAAQLRELTVQWLQQSSYVMWPKACDGRNFDYSVLSDPLNGSGVARLDSQYLRANIDPTECCVGSPAGSTKFRLGPADSGFSNLFLAGEATRHGFNTTTIEGAVMSGLAAARAVCGAPTDDIVGYDFLRTPPSKA